MPPVWKMHTLMGALLGGLALMPAASAQEAPPASGAERVHMAVISNLLSFSGVFNLGRGTVRIVVLASPTCPGCAEATSHVLSTCREIESKRLRAYIVYAPMLPSDTQLSAVVDASQWPGCPRAALFWDADRVCAQAWEPYLHADSVAAGAVFLYDADAKFGLTPPKPFWMQRHECVETPAFAARAFAESTRVHVEALEAQVRAERGP